MNKNIPDPSMSTIIVTALSLLVLVVVGAFFISGSQNKTENYASECVEWIDHTYWTCIGGEIVNKSDINSTTSTHGNCTLDYTEKVCTEY